MRYTLFIAVSVSILMSGCSEKPEREAAREVRKSSEQARSIISDSRKKARLIVHEGDRAASEAVKNGNIDGAAAISQEQFDKAQKLISDSFEQARAEIENSLRKSRIPGNTETPALITSGNILFGEALYLQSGLVGVSSPIDSFIDKISSSVLLMGDLATSKAQRQEMIDANEKEMQQLTDVLDGGSDDYPGLKAKLNAEENKLAEIERKIKELKSEANTAAEMANLIEKSAMEKLRAADALSGDEKLALQNEAFDLRLSKKKYSMDLQAAKDKITILDSRAAITAPVVEKIIADISAVKDKIEAITSAGGNAKLTADLTEIESKYNAHAESVSNYIKGTSAALKDYLTEFDKVTALLDQALGQYEKVKRGASTLTAKNRKAACYLWKAGVYAEGVRTQKNLISRIKSIIAAADAATAGNLEKIVSAASTTADEHANAALKNYDLAAKEYEGISASGNFDCTVCKSHILALFGKMTLAEYLGSTTPDKAQQTRFFDISDNASADAEKLVKKAKECDPMFSSSITGKMWGGEIDWIPELRVDLAGYYEEVRKKFQGWNKLKGADQKEAAVKKFILELETMAPGKDPEAFDRILMPELIQLKAALKKGFDETALINTNSAGGDPNY
ncbi:MAG: hypothetical protein K9M75_13280 [Phycisphaerae bacterium]|nr:hypothetical protein [Phycisphaerae bacterium]